MRKGRRVGAGERDGGKESRGGRERWTEGVREKEREEKERAGGIEAILPTEW